MTPWTHVSPLHHVAGSDCVNNEKQKRVNKTFSLHFLERCFVVGVPLELIT
jgi:hypothetical protein